MWQKNLNLIRTHVSDVVLVTQVLHTIEEPYKRVWSRTEVTLAILRTSRTQQI